MRGAAHRVGVPAFWHWWIGQLAPLVPAVPRNALQRRRLRPLLEFGADAVVIWVPRVANGAIEFAEAARVPLSGDPATVTQAGRAAIDALARVAYGGAVAPSRVVIVLPIAQVLRKELTLPAAVEDNLLQTLAYDIDRHTPFKADEVYFDAIVVGRDPVRKEIRVDWAAALKSVVDQARRRVETWGATVVGVWPAMPAGAAAFSSRAPNLLPATDRPDANGWRRWELWVPAGLILALALVAIAVPLWQKRSHAIALGHLVEQAHLQANASDALRQQLEQLAGDYNFALQRKYAFPSAMQVLDDLTRLLPDDTWLTQLEVKTLPKGKEPHRDIVLRGESSNAGRLVSLLEESKLFEQAAPRSPTTKIQPGPGEIFDLGAQLKPLTPPPPVQLAGSTTPLPRPAAPAAAAIPPSALPPSEAAKDVEGPRNGTAGVAAPAPVASEPPQAPPAPTNRTERAPGS